MAKTPETIDAAPKAVFVAAQRAGNENRVAVGNTEQSIQCSTLQAPACPSLVTWPTITIATPRVFGEARPGRLPFRGHGRRLRGGWMSAICITCRSITISFGCSSSAIGRICSMLVFGEHIQISGRQAGQCARIATCCSDSSPVRSVFHLLGELAQRL